MARNLQNRTAGIARQALRSALVGATTVLAAASPAAAAPDALCGRSGSISELLLGLQRPEVESLWRDKMLFVVRDGQDGTLWAFSIKNTTVHPAVRCRRAVAGAARDSGLLCASSEKSCASFAAQADERFDALTTPAAAR